jgi:LysR family cyn operon transcriptional activator
MNVSGLNYIVALAKLGTMTQVAEKFYISPSAVSQCIHKEEQELGVTLFQYIDHRMIPTETGKTYISYAKKILAVQESTDRKIRSLSQTSDALHIVLAPLHEDYFKAQILPKLGRCFSEINMVTTTINSRMSVEYLLNSIADIAIIPLPYHYHQTMLEGIELDDDRLILIVPKAYLLRITKDTPRIEDCETIPFILLRNGSYMRSMADHLLQTHHIISNRIYEVDSYITCREFLESGRGATFLPSHLLPPHAEEHFFIFDPEPALRFQNKVIFPSFSPEHDKLQRIAEEIHTLWQ